MITSVYCPASPSPFQRSQSCFSPPNPVLLFDPLSLVMLLRSLGGPDSDIRCLVWLDGNMNLHRNFIIKYVHREARKDGVASSFTSVYCLKAGSLTKPFQLDWPAGKLWICLSLSPSAVAPCTTMFGRPSLPTPTSGDSKLGPYACRTNTIFWDIIHLLFFFLS